MRANLIGAQGGDLIPLEASQRFVKMMGFQHCKQNRWNRARGVLLLKTC
jgi:hypothetical protein